MAQLAAEFVEVFLSPDGDEGRVGAEFVEVFAGSFTEYGRACAVFVEVFATFEVEEAMSCAGKPGAWFVLPDPKLRGESNIVSATSEAGPYPGPAAPVAGNMGLLFPLQSGELSAAAEPVVYGVVQAGGPGVGEYVWRYASETVNDYRGVDDVRRFYGYNTPIKSPVGSDNCACVFAERFRRMLVCNIDDATNTVTIAYRDIDTSRYDVWSTTTFAMTRGSVAGGHHNVQLIDLPDGRLMMVIRTVGPDFDVYHSEDGGLTWQLVSDSIVNTFNTPDVAEPTHDLTSQFRLARSGEHIRLVWMTAAGVVRTFLSTDRGISWQRIEDLDISPSTWFNSGATDDPFAFTVLPVDDTGTFILWGVVNIATGAVRYQTTGAAGWSYLSNPVAPPGAIKQIVSVKTPEWLCVYTYYSDTGAGTADGWQLARVRPAGYATGVGDPLQWEYLQEAQRYDTGVKYAPGRLSACWAGNAVFFYGARRNSGATYTDENFGLSWLQGGWTKRSLWRNRPNRSLLDIDATPLYGRFWTVECDAPDVPGGSPWTATGTGTATTTMDELQIDSTFGNAKRYVRNIAAAAGPAWGQDQDACFGWTAHLGTGDGALGSDDVAVRIISQDQADTTQLDVSIRMAPTGCRVYDNVAAAGLDDVLVTLDTGGPAAKYFEFRFWMAKQGVNYRAQLAIFDTGTKEWTVGDVVTLTSAAVAGSNEVRFGNLSSPAAGTTTSYWREFWVCEDNNGHQEGFVNPIDLAGLAMSAGTPTYIAHGLSVQWGGLGGALEDTFNGDLLHQHPAGAIALDSPRLDWRSTSLSNQTIILDADPENGVHRWVHDAIGLFGCNNRQVLVDYDTDVAFGSPTATQTVDFTAFNTGTTALVALLPGGTSLLIVPAATTQFVKGELVGYYARVTSGPAAGATWKITRHDARDVLHFEEETTTLLAQGLLPTNTLVIFSPNAVLSYSVAVNERYMRLRFQDNDTAEGYHRLGTLVPGSRQNIDVPFDWAHTDNHQPNLTQHRTRGAVQWYYEEGPPQRTWSGRMVGDATQRQRDKLRGLLRSIGYEQKPLAWVFEDERPVESCALVRSVGGNQQDNAGWYRDANGVLHTMGDLSVTLTEEV